MRTHAFLPFFKACWEHLTYSGFIFNHSSSMVIFNLAILFGLLWVTSTTLCVIFLGIEFPSEKSTLNKMPEGGTTNCSTRRTLFFRFLRFIYEALLVILHLYSNPFSILLIVLKKMAPRNDSTIFFVTICLKVADLQMRNFKSLAFPRLVSCSNLHKTCLG